MFTAERRYMIGRCWAPLAALLAVVLILVSASPLALAQESWKKEWAETVAAAKKEGRLVYSLGRGPIGILQPLFDQFEQTYGIEVITVLGTGRQQGDRISAERRAGKYEVDVITMGASTALRLVKAKAADPIADVFFHPEVIDQSKWYLGRHHYHDPQQTYVFAYAGDVRPPLPIHFNTDQVSVKEGASMTSVYDWMKPRFKGKIVTVHPFGKLGSSYESYLLQPQLGEKFLRRLFDPELEVFFTDDVRILEDGLIRGKFAVDLENTNGSRRAFRRLAKQGLPVAAWANVLESATKEPGQLNTSINSIMVANRRPHRNAAKLWVNWFLSKEGQTALHTKAGAVPAPSLRRDVPLGMVLRKEVPVDGKQYLMIQASPDYARKAKELRDQGVIERLWNEVRGK